MLSTTQNRALAVAQANANAGIEGFEPEQRDLELQERFITGEISVLDMLQEALEDAAAAGEGGSA